MITVSNVVDVAMIVGVVIGTIIVILIVLDGWS